jgi:hypothetical protein
LSEAERTQIVAVCNEPRFAETSPARIVPPWPTKVYIASESSFHRVLRDHGQMNRRGRPGGGLAARFEERSDTPHSGRSPSTETATQPH